MDGLLNGLGITAQWRGLRRDYDRALCGGNLQVLGLCVEGLTGLGLRSGENQ